MAERAANIKRETQETAVNVTLTIDGKGEFEITTGPKGEQATNVVKI